MKTPTITLKKTTPEELDLFVQMEIDDDTSPFIIPYSFKKHQQSYSQSEIRYLTIYFQNKICGYFILAFDIDEKSIEFRRIVVSEKGKGIGQETMLQMHNYCKTVLNKTRVWLDVFEHNKRGRHIYEKLGYVHFKSEPCDNHTLHFYEITL